MGWAIVLGKRPSKLRTRLLLSYFSGNVDLDRRSYYLGIRLYPSQPVRSARPAFSESSSGRFSELRDVRLNKVPVHPAFDYAQPRFQLCIFGTLFLSDSLSGL